MDGWDFFSSLLFSAPPLIRRVFAEISKFNTHPSTTTTHSIYPMHLSLLLLYLPLFLFSFSFSSSLMALFWRQSRAANFEFRPIRPDHTIPYDSILHYTRPHHTRPHHTTSHIIISQLILSTPHSHKPSSSRLFSSLLFSPLTDVC